jgi:large subunit ribosomal protein L6
MSRIGKNAVTVPSGVQVSLSGQQITAKGPKGQLAMHLVDEIVASMEGNKVALKPRDNSRRAKTMWGMQRTLVNNLVNGVAKGYQVDLEISGVGYRANVQGKNLVLQLGFSHEIVYPIPPGIDIKVDKQVSVSIAGADKRQVGQVAAEIRSYRPPEPYKGKGIKYSDEKILRKEGKKK